jgi:hypothetical protein
MPGRGAGVIPVEPISLAFEGSPADSGDRAGDRAGDMRLGLYRRTGVNDGDRGVSDAIPGYGRERPGHLHTTERKRLLF